MDYIEVGIESTRSYAINSGILTQLQSVNNRQIAHILNLGVGRA